MAPKTLTIISELVASVGQIAVGVGDDVAAGAQVALLESMKMEIPVLAERAGRVLEVKVAAGDVVQEGDVLVVLQLVD